MKNNNYVHNFAQLPETYIPRSVFDRNHSYKTTFNSGYLIPFYIDEALPADTFKLNCTALARLATPIVPFMDNIYLDVFFFAVPNRLVWEHWQNFCGERSNPNVIYDGVIPTVELSPSDMANSENLADYFGISLVAGDSSESIKVNALPFRCYNLIWNEWFRDENLQDNAFFDVSDDSSSLVNYPLRKRGKRHDYFTSCLPWPQKGVGVELPLGVSAPVIGDGNAIRFNTPMGQKVAGVCADGHHRGLGISNKEINVLAGTSVNMNFDNDSLPNKAIGLALEDSGMIADLTEATSATINSLRQAFALQHFYERDARGGTRYTEILRSHFGVVSPDARLQRPEYLGGTSIPFSVNSVPQTSSTDGTTPQGNLSAYSMCTAQSGFVKSFVEHCYIVGLCCVRADLSYQQGTNKLWWRSLKTDFYWPSFAHIGEQAVLNKEIYTQGVDADDDVFGYQERYAEYRYHPSLITGKLRSQADTSLDVWHLSQDFGELPKLNSEFIEETPPIDRVIAVTDEPQFILDTYFDLRCVRPMPVYSTPGLTRM